MKLIAIAEDFLTSAVREFREKDTDADPTHNLNLGECEHRLANLGRDTSNFLKGAALSKEDKVQFAFANGKRLTGTSRF